MGRLKDKITIITGAARGIGEETARLFVEQGAVVVLTDILPEVFDVAKELNAKGFNAIAMKHDVSSISDWKNVIKAATGINGKLDILINNAGIGGPQGIFDTTIEQWEKVQSINLKSVFLGIKCVAFEMKNRNNGGSIVNVSSIYGKIGTGGASSYHASKAGITGLTKTLAVELAPYYIRINTVHPGVIKTKMTAKKFENKEILEELSRLTPWPEFGTPEDVANGILFLASDEARFVTGHELIIDGGYLAK